MTEKIPAVKKSPQKEDESSRTAYRQQCDSLAKEISEAFNDPGHLPIYQVYCRNFPHRDVRRAFAEARAVPQHKVRRTRLALFIYLLKSYAWKDK